MKNLYSFIIAAFIGTTSLMAQPGYTMLKYTITPTDGATVSVLNEIAISFPDPADGIDANIMGSNIGNYATLTCGNTVIKATKLEAGTRGGNTATAYITFPETKTPGTYVFHLDEKVLKDYEESETAEEGDGYSVNPPITATYTIPASHQPETTMSVYEIDPADGSVLKDIEVVNIVFPKTSSKDGIDAFTSSPKAYLLKDGEIVATATNLKVVSPFDRVKVTFDAAITEPGKYTFRLPAETYYDFTTSGDEAISNPEINVTYTINGTSGVENIATDNGDKTVYDLFGRKMNSSKLPAGIYIINGKKTFVR